LAVEHIMRLEGWESLDVVLRYTRSVKFDECSGQGKTDSQLRVYC
jgi:hypothetical protein